MTAGIMETTGVSFVLLRMIVRKSCNCNARKRNNMHGTEVAFQVFEVTADGNHRRIVGRESERGYVYLPTIATGISVERVAQSRISRHASRNGDLLYA